jgi:outer membrane protein assembly factor BamB
MYRDEHTPAPLVITAFNHRVIALSAVDGSVAWQVSLHVERIVVDAHQVYCVSMTGSVVAHDYVTGAERWRVETGLSVAGPASMLLARDILYVSLGGETAALSTRGKLLWVNKLPGTGFGTAEIAVPGAVVHGDRR